MTPPIDPGSLQYLSRQVLFLLDRSSRIVGLSPAAAALTEALQGRRPQVGDRLVDFSLPEARDAFLARVAAAFEGHRHRILRELTYPSGDTRVFDVTYDPIPDAEGAIAQVLFGAVDVTEASVRQRRLDLIEHALAHTAEGVLIADATAPDFPIVFANDGVLRMTGYPRDAFLGRNCRFLNASRSDQPGLARIRAALGAGDPVRVEVENRRADGTWFWNEVSLSPIHDGEGRLTHFLGIQRDVTEERRLRERARRLERLHAIESTAASVVHDLNNLLGLLDLGLEEALERIRDPETARTLEDLREAVASGSLVARRTLEQASGPPVPTDLTALLTQRLALLQRLAGRQVDLELVLPDAPVRVRMESSAVEQVITNLVGNAGEALADGRGSRVVVAVEPGRGTARLTVTDDGPGVPPELRPRIFEPFVTSRTSRGTGLGLATCRRVVEQAGGRIDLDSAPGRTRFLVELPLVDVEAGLETAAPLQLLHVEDEPLIRRVVGRWFQGGPHRVRQVESLEEARQASQAAAFDVLITDLDLPDGSGADLAEALRATRPELGIVVTTGDLYTTLDPAWVRVAKPFTLPALEEAIARARTRAGDRRGSAG